MDSVGPLDIPIMRHENESSYVVRLATMVDFVETVRGLMGLEPCCLDRLYSQYSLQWDADAWSQKRDSELRHRRGPARRLLGLQNTEVSA